MNRFALLLTFVVGSHFTSPAQPQHPAIPSDVKRIIFLGNSITYAGTYIEYIDAYLTIQYPDREFEIINVGLPSETVSGLSEPNHANGAFPRPDLRERLDRVLTQTKPDLILACYGMNDGIYLPFDDNRFNKFREGLIYLHDEAIKAGAKIIHITPPIYDERKGEAYANVLDLYSDWLISKHYTENWEVIDIHTPMKTYLKEQRLIDSDFVLAHDGIHPDTTGHFIMAKQILINLGETSISEVKNIKSLLAIHPNGEKILKLIEQKQRTLKDAWLTSTGHTRPQMNIGLPMNEAQKKFAEIRNELAVLLE